MPRNSHPADDRGDLRVVATAMLLSLLVATVFALSRGEIRTHWHHACLERVSDMQPFARHLIQGSVDDTHPLFAYYIRVFRDTALRPFGFLLVTGSVKAGIPFEVALGIQTAIFRGGLALGIALLLYAACRRPWVAWFGVAFAFAIPQDARIYGLIPLLGITGTFTTGIFLSACALLLLRFRSLAVLVWLFQAWAHPTTFISWSPLFLALLADVGPSRFAPREHPRLWSAILVAGPLLGGLTAGAAEAVGWLDLGSSPEFWALNQVRGYHSIFRHTPMFYYPLVFLSQVAALFLLGSGERGADTSLRVLNRMGASLGLGLLLLHTACVETHGSTLAAMLVPLRYECVMFPLILANVLHAMLRAEPGRSGEAWWAAGYGAILLFPAWSPLLWAWAWALGHAWLRGGRQRGGAYLAAAVVGAAAVGAFLVFGPSELAPRENLPRLRALMQPAVWLALLAVAAALRPPASRRVFVALLCVAVVFLWWRERPFRPRTCVAEVRALALGIPERTPEKHACDWLSEHISRGEPVLVHPTLYLHRVSSVKGSITDDISGFHIYAPRLAGPIAREVRALYGWDVLDAAAQRQRISLLADGDRWTRARESALAEQSVGGYAFRYVIEPAAIVGSAAFAPLFSNDWVRVYEAGPAGMRGPSAGR